MDEDLEELQLMLKETESIHNSLSPYCLTVADVSFQDSSLQEPKILFDGSQSVVKSLDSGVYSFERRHCYDNFKQLILFDEH